MEAIHQGVSAALVLVGLAALLFGVAALWRVVGNAKAREQELRLDRDAHEMAAERFRERAARDRSRLDLLYTLVPAGTVLLGHWLGSQSGRHGYEGLGLPWGGFPRGSCPGWDECIPRPRGSVAPADEDDDEMHVELDLGSLFEAISETGFGEWLSNVMRGAKRNRTAASGASAPDDDAELTPTPTVTAAANE